MASLQKCSYPGARSFCFYRILWQLNSWIVWSWWMTRYAIQCRLIRNVGNWEKPVKRVINTAQKIVGCFLHPPLETMSMSHYQSNNHQQSSAIPPTPPTTCLTCCPSIRSHTTIYLFSKFGFENSCHVLKSKEFAQNGSIFLFGFATWPQNC